MSLSRIVLLCLTVLASDALAATNVRVDFVLNTADAYGNPIQQNRYYLIYRPDNLPKSAPVPVILAMDNGALLQRKADQAGFVVVSCSSTGTGWNNDDPRVSGYQDYDYITEVINRVRASDNTNDAFTVGFSTGGHTSLAYACVRPSTIKAAASIDEFMGLTTNIPTAPLPVILFHGAADASVPYTMVRDTVDAWRMVDGLMNQMPVTTYESSPLMPGKVSQATWLGGIGDTQVAFVTIIGGSHQVPTPATETGYDYADGLWAFFSQFLTSTQGAPRIVSQPANNTQISGQPASFHVVATGSAPFSYNLQMNGGEMSASTGNWFTIPATTLDDNGSTFRLVVNSDSGRVISSPATLTVKAAPAGPTITSQPAEAAAVGGQPVGFRVTAAGTPPIRYQWQKNGIDVAGATAASLDIAAALLSDSGANFSVVATNADGSTISNRAMLTVFRAPGAPIILANPVRARVVLGQTASMSVSAWSATPMTYQWQTGPSTGNLADIPGATDATYTVPITTLADNKTLLRCVVSNSAGSVTSASEMLAVNAAPTAPTKIASAITAFVQVGTPFQYTIVSSGGTAPILYQAAPLPDGLSLDPVSGVISGTPAATGITSITIDAGNRAGDASAILTLTVTDTPPVITIDAWRFANFGASAIDPSIAGDMADPDADGYTNLEEFTAGSHPLDATSVPAVPPRGVVRKIAPLWEHL